MPKAMGTAIVVGASSGIGKAIAEQLVAGGWKVGLTSRKLENLVETIARLGEGAAAKAIDLDDPEGARSILDEVLKEGNPNQRKEAERLLAGLP